jgi:hypothetical protein
MKTAPLNSYLFLRLKALFGLPGFINQGQALVGTTVWNEARGRNEFRTRLPGEYYRVNCFAGETLVTTANGDQPIRSLVGKQTLLIPNKKNLGLWKEVQVKSFGVQPLLTVHLRRGNSKKTIRVTPDHRWTVVGEEDIVLTRNLTPGSKLTSCYARNYQSYGAKAPVPSFVAVAQGFTFGDGSKGTEDQKPAHTDLIGQKDKVMLRYFRGYRQTPIKCGEEKVPRIKDLPRFWKELPPADESLSFLLGWLAGYFAADGNVGSSAYLDSADWEALNFAKGILYRLGVRVSPISTKDREGFGEVRTLYTLAFDVKGLPDSFWVMPHHKSAARKIRKRKDQTTRYRYWTVTRVEDRSEMEEVFCAVVPDVEKFTLADNIQTMNCPFCNDTRKRLYVSYMFGQKDNADRVMTYMAVCYNETACMTEYDNRLTLIEKLNGKIPKKLETVEVRPGKRSARLTTAIAPGPIARLNSLEPSHRARAYMESRGFNVDTLTNYYDYGYCTRSHELLAARRVYIPFYFKHKFVGWQCRLPEDLAPGVKFPPKYFTMPGLAKQFMLVNFDNAIQWNTGVVVEGALDVVGWGPQAMGVLGNRISDFQIRLLINAYAGRKLVVLLDPKEMSKPYTLERVAELRRGLGRKNVAAVTLPDDTDPGSLDRPFLKEYVTREARDQKVKLDFSLASNPGLKG